MNHDIEVTSHITPDKLRITSHMDIHCTKKLLQKQTNPNNVNTFYVKMFKNKRETETHLQAEGIAFFNQNVWDGEPHSTLGYDNFCFNLPSSWIQHPSRNGTGPVAHSSEDIGSGRPLSSSYFLYGVVENAGGSGVFSLYRGGRLWPSHINEGLTIREHLLCGDELSTKFRLSCRGHDELDYFCNGEDGTIEAQEGIIFGEKDVGASSSIRIMPLAR